MKNKVILLVSLIIIICLYIITGVPFCQKYKKNIEIEKEIQSLKIEDVDKIIFNFNAKYNNGIGLLLEGDEKEFFLGIIKNAENFNPNHPDVDHIGVLTLYTKNDSEYMFDIFIYENMNMSYLAWQFDGFGRYKSYELYEWVINILDNVNGD